jgi:hypothetical protein
MTKGNSFVPNASTSLQIIIIIQLNTLFVYLLMSSQWPVTESAQIRTTESTRQHKDETNKRTKVRKLIS